MLDRDDYPTGLKVADKEMRSLNLTRSVWHGEWNYSLAPRPN